MTNFRTDYIAGEEGHPALHNDISAVLNYVTYSSRYGTLANAIDDALNGSGRLQIPAGTLNLSPLTLDGGLVVEGAGQGKTILKCTTDEPLFTGDMASHVTLRNLTLDVNGGAALAGDWVGCQFENVTFLQRDSDVPIIDHDSSEGGAFQENLFLNCWMYATEGHTVPAVRLVGTNTVNGNRWVGGRYTYSGDYVFHLEGVSNSSFLCDNVFDGITFEVTVGGNIRLIACVGTVIKAGGTYDTHLVGEITNSLYKLETNAHNLRCQRTTFLAAQRNGGTLADGVYDIDAENQIGTLLLNTGSPVSDYRVRLSGPGSFALNDKSVGIGKIGMTSPDGTLYAVGVSNAGVVEAVEV